MNLSIKMASKGKLSTKKVVKKEIEEEISKKKPQLKKSISQKIVSKKVESSDDEKPKKKPAPKKRVSSKSEEEDEPVKKKPAPKKRVVKKSESEEDEVKKKQVPKKRSTKKSETEEEDEPVKKKPVPKKRVSKSETEEEDEPVKKKLVPKKRITKKSETEEDEPVKKKPTPKKRITKSESEEEPVKKKPTPKKKITKKSETEEEEEPVKKKPTPKKKVSSKSEEEEIYTKESLTKKTIPMLQKIAKQKNVELTGKEKKDLIIKKILDSEKKESKKEHKIKFKKFEDDKILLVGLKELEFILGQLTENKSYIEQIIKELDNESRLSTTITKVDTGEIIELEEENDEGGDDGETVEEKPVVSKELDVIEKTKEELKNVFVSTKKTKVDITPDDFESFMKSMKSGIQPSNLLDMTQDSGLPEEKVVYIFMKLGELSKDEKFSRIYEKYTKSTPTKQIVSGKSKFGGRGKRVL